MNIKFRGNVLDCRKVVTSPGRFRLGDIVLGPEGNLLEVKTIQKDCPIFESMTRTKCVVVFETESGACVPVNGIAGTFTVFRRRGIQ